MGEPLIAFQSVSAYARDVPIVKSKTRTTKRNSDAELLDGATLRLMRAVKEKAAKAGKPIKRSELLKQGYSERFVAKVEKA